MERVRFAVDDPLPSLAMSGSWLCSGVRKGAHRMRTGAPHLTRPVPAHPLGPPQQP
ncbi:hypothetical protein [Streptomyces halobius]|uniref:Uncharacterized protein n=1 Tax=Streptomyces halobius TaxID=2879846 RepID=A0ABY4MFT3_9ACTN|nr:hypothetical protein [Streptomyces halobius]UQA95275.1 hypothetical protein K9S39_28535 [Streptomyces halobius]